MNLRDQLQSIYRQRGELTPAIVVDEARPADAPLHDRFEWDDSIAGEKYREVQAAELIRSVKVVYTDQPEERSVRAFVSVQRDDHRGYVPTEEAVADDFTRKLLLAECRREWEAFKAKYSSLEEFAAIVNGAAVGAA